MRSLSSVFKFKRKKILAVTLIWTILVSAVLLVIVNNFVSGDTIPSDGPYIKITVDSGNRTRYGFVYPLTYVFSVPDDASGLKVWLRYDPGENWVQLPENTSDDFFNGIYAVRFNYTENKAYVSVGFSGTGDSINLRFTDSSNNGVYDVSYLGISQYYDNRKCVVTVTMDDWDAERSSYFLRAIDLLQERQMWVTSGIVTNGIAYLGESFNATTWTEIQNEINEGFVEPASHSRTHPHPPYSNTTSEVQGSRDDIIGNLTYIPYSWGSNKYVYAWFEPFGEWDDAVRAEVGQSDYIVDREYYYTSDVSWGDYNSSLGIYSASHYPDPGGRWDDTAAIDSVFDQAYDNGYIYHGFFHPAGGEYSRLTEAQWQNITAHLDYISGRKDVWYVGFGQLYMYHYLQQFSSQLLSVETVGFITDTTNSDFQQGAFNNVEIVNGSLTLTVFPTVPGTLGNTAFGGSNGNYWPDEKFGSKFTLSQAASLTRISVALRDYTEQGKANAVKAAIYDASFNLLGQTGTANLPATFQWVTMNFSSPLSLSPGDYWLDVCINQRAEFKYVAGGTNQFHYKSVTFSNEFTNPFGTPNGYQNWNLNIYADLMYMGIGDGSFVSKWQDAGKTVDWTTISWSGTISPETNIIISTRTAPELFKGVPDESRASPWSTNVTNPAGSPIASPDNRFIQYKAYLSTDNSNAPALQSVTVFYGNSSLPQPTYATLTIDSTPVKGECFINSTSIGIAPQTRTVVSGNYAVSWGDVEGYNTPTSQIVTLAEDETKNIVGIYEVPPPPPAQYKLSIYSQPLNGFKVEIANTTDTFQINTGTSIVLTEGGYNITIIDTSIEITFEQWAFDSWSDGNTSASRTITLSEDTILLYDYVHP